MTNTRLGCAPLGTASLGSETHGVDLETLYPLVDEGAFETLTGKHHQVTIEKRPEYCDRGHLIAKVFAVTGSDIHTFTIDDADGWPRYYMRHDAAVQECRDWLAWREEGIP